MDCRASIIYAQLLVPELDPREVRYGQLLTMLAAASALLPSAAIRLAVRKPWPGPAGRGPDAGNR